MVIRVSKPEFNLRSKINELDFTTLDYDKMPIGSIVQVREKYCSNHNFTTANQAWTAISDFNIKFTPRCYNSTVIFETNFTAMLNDDDGYARYRLVDYDHPNGTATLHSRTYCAASHYKTSTDDWIEVVVRTKFRVEHLGQHHLVLQGWVYNGGTLSLNWSGSDFRVLKIMEIKQ